MPTEHSAGVIIFKKGEYLLLYRKAHDNYREGWLFPRGLIEIGESVEATVRREVKEETGISDLFFVKGFKADTKWFYRKEGKLVFKTATYLLAETGTEKVKISEEHDGFAWLSFSEAMQRLTFRNDKDVLKKANDFMEKAQRE